VAELALDDDQRHAVARQFDGVDVAQLVRCEAAADTGRASCSPQLGACPRA
jgi:hypothetical protein